ncbi:O-antigen ligase family protein [Schlesneria paludicola]|uniref:O-antigen ligase family protein n=1 Tax=Schlesneria paludicola TaxID=360056 RepID=UPI00029B4D5F|nr:O-antigen ligase family protein [Schlesneria paludicola]
MTARLPTSRVPWFSPRSIGGGLILSLFLLRFFDVAESAGQGETLWVVALWLVAWALSAILLRWLPPPQGSPFGWLDLCVSLLAGGHLVSAAAVMATAGEKRTALNLAWEWCGVLVAWFLLRRQCQQVLFRRDLLAAFIAIGAVMSGLGLYQHYVEFPGLAAKYGPMFDRLKVADPGEKALIRQELMAQQIPVEGAGVTLFEKRLRDSREPLGLFALANTFGGFLAVCLILTVGAGIAVSGSAKGGALNRLVWIGILILLGWCLMLTKSRTAWAGILVASVPWFLSDRRIRWTRTRVLGRLGACSLLLVAIWGLGRLGGLDRQVLTEAPKSLGYRMQYWRATLAMIADHPVLGVGLGQFRTAYLFYKLPEASEEIADPHNLFLDVYANGGLLAVCGLAGFCVAFLVGRHSPVRASIDSLPDSAGDATDSPEFFIVAVAALVGWGAALLTGYDDRLLIVLPATVGLFFLIRRQLRMEILEAHAVRVAITSAVLALLVHLLGAGGIGMPAISLLLLTLAALANQEPRWLIRFGAFPPAGTEILQIGLSVVLLGGLVWSAWRPSRIVQVHLQAGDGQLQRGRKDAAEVEYAAAATADSLTPEPWRRRAELAYLGVEAGGFRSNASWENAVGLMREAHARDPANGRDDQRVGEWCLARWRVTNRPADAIAAVEALDRAWKRYPTSAFLMSDLAKAYVAKGDTESAVKVASQALQQDEINRAWGHVDRILPEPVRNELEMLVKQAGG